MPRFFPSCMPDQLTARPELRGERRVWEALRQAPLPAATSVFYNRAPEGCRRRHDFLIVDPARGIIAIEVKGGRVHYRAGFHQHFPGERWSKRIEPWMQARRALQQTYAALGLNTVAIPCVPLVALPATARDALPFPPPHMLMLEDLAPVPLARKLDILLPRLDPATRDALAPTFESILAALTRPGDEQPAFLAYSVRPGRPWLRIGSAFHQGHGLAVQFDALPLNFAGRILLVEPKIDPCQFTGLRPAPQLALDPTTL
jgi:hypothetical protein